MHVMIGQVTTALITTITDIVITCIQNFHANESYLRTFLPR